MVTVSCIAKLHAFALSEQLQKHQVLNNLYTTYASRKNTFLSRYVKRIDKEDIEVKRINTNTVLAFSRILFPRYWHVWNELFDQWVANQLKYSSSKVFIGWSGMSLNSIRAAKKKGMITILERGSSHIAYQNDILREEYKKFGIDFSIRPTVVEKEIKEYELTDFISIPSLFVKDSFLKSGVPEKKLFLNNYGSSFLSTPTTIAKAEHPFRILYVGNMSIQKGMIYLFEALAKLTIDYEAWFFGSMDNITESLFSRHKNLKWKYFGRIGHYDLPGYISQCDVAVQCSLQEGLSMVIPEIINCGVPIIATTNTGGLDIVEEGKNGFIVPIRSSLDIVNKINFLAENPAVLEYMKNYCKMIENHLTWDRYGNNYVGFLRKFYE